MICIGRNEILHDEEEVYIEFIITDPQTPEKEHPISTSISHKFTQAIISREMNGVMLIRQHVIDGHQRTKR